MARLPLEQKPNLRGVAGMVRGGFFLRKKPLGDSASRYTNSFAIRRVIVVLNSAYSNKMNFRVVEVWDRL